MAVHVPVVGGAAAGAKASTALLDQLNARVDAAPAAGAAALAALAQGRGR